MKRSAFVATLVVGAVSAAQASAQAPPVPPDHYALTNVRIVVAPGQVIEQGTIVVRDGRIVAVGPRAAVPAQAIRVDATGHTAYAGLIDAASSVGLPAMARQGGGFGGGGGGGGGGAQAGAGQEVMPAREASDVWNATDADLAALRAAGVTTVGLAFSGGIFPGRVAAANTGGGKSRVLRTGIAQQVLLGRRRGGYPGTLMASLAYVKQSFYDAQHETRVRQAWSRQPTGPRPAFDADARALEPAASGALPVWLHASTERDLDRIIELARDIGVSGYTIVGAQEGWRALDVLRRAGRPVIVSIDFPAANQISGRAFELNVAPVSGVNEGARDADSAAVRQARGNAAALVRAGLPVALSAYGMTGADRLRDNVRAAIAEGLAPDDALRALTVTPARLLGIESVAGTIETGKLANIIVVSGNDLFAEDARIRDVFVEGVRYEIPAPPARQERGAERGARAADVHVEVVTVAPTVAGQWVGELDGPAGLMQFTLELRGSGSELTGELGSELGNVALTGSQSGSDITLSGTFSMPGRNAMAITIAARVTDDDLRGTLTAQGMSAIEFNARRRGPGSADAEMNP